MGGLEQSAYAHHIQRLMLFGNLMMLTGVDPREAFDWFHESFIDGYEWVMAANVYAMGLFADGGRMFTKPYAAGGRYVDRMSDYCGDCRYDPTQAHGRRRLPVQLPLLGLPGPPFREPPGQPAAEHALPQPGPDGPRRA